MLLTEHFSFRAIALLLLPEIFKSTASFIFGGMWSYTNVHWSIISSASQLSWAIRYARADFSYTDHPLFAKHVRQQFLPFFLCVTSGNFFPQYSHFLTGVDPMHTVKDLWRYCVTLASASCSGVEFFRESSDKLRACDYRTFCNRSR
jgi:hypothetical protein